MEYHIISSRLFLFIATLLIAYRLNAQTSIDAVESCNDQHVKTILLYRSGWEMSMPVIFTDESEVLDLAFDYLDTFPASYNYSVENCTYNWKVNDVSEHDYIKDFNDESILEVHSSLNTIRSYTHFSASFPNDELKITKSGNFLLKVYQNGEPDKILFTRRFCIAERLAGISATVKRPDDENQEIELVVDLGNLQLENPLGETKVVIIKNYDWNNRVKIEGFPQLQDNKLVYSLPYQIESKGGNEFRDFDTKNTKTASERVGSIVYQPPYFHFHLKNDESRQFKPYFTNKDLNGRFYIDAPDAQDRQLEADYVFVHFTLKAMQPYDANVYIYGALTNYMINGSSMMNYNTDKAAYEKTLLLKQGYYNYVYTLKESNKKDIDFEPTEGTHSETENDYLIFVYLKRPMSDFDRLIGFKIVNSMGEAK